MLNFQHINVIEAERLLAEGKTRAEVAAHFGVTRQAVWKMLKKKREGSLTVRADPKKYSLDGLGPFKAVMGTVLSEIKHLNTEIKTAEGESRSRLNIERLKYCAEARKEFEVAIELDEKRFAIEEVLKFRDFVIEKIGEVDEETRDEIIKHLNRGHALRKLVSGP